MAYNRSKPPVKKSPEQKRAEAAEGLAAVRAEEAAINRNMLRLRALRLARDAETPPAPAPAGRAKQRSKPSGQ